MNIEQGMTIGEVGEIIRYSYFLVRQSIFSSEPMNNEQGMTIGEVGEILRYS